MKNFNIKRFRRWTAFLLCAVLAALLLGCAGKDTAVETGEPDLNDPDTVIAATIDVSMEAMEKYPNAQHVVVTDEASGLLELVTGKADIFIDQTSAYEKALQNGYDLLLHSQGPLSEPGKVAVGISPRSKFPNAEAQVNAFLQEMEENGTLDDIYQRWVIDGNYTMPEIEPAENPTYTIVVGTTGLLEPYTFWKDETLTGSDIELAYRFAAWAGVDIEFRDFDWSGIRTALETGMVDYAFSDLFVTNEESGSVLFSQPYMTYELPLMYLDKSTVKSDVFSGILESFENAFIRENRWKLVASGLDVTLEITLLAAIFGTVLGFLLFYVNSKKSKLLKGLVRAYITIMTGVPVLVVLMFTYFIAFANTGTSSLFASVVAFSLMFGVSVEGLLETGIGSIDNGQREAAAALGFSKSTAFWQIILPQSVSVILPGYKVEFVNMMKLTSVVGYISLRDLTKAADIIRARTYESVFPILANAMLYCLLSWLILRLVGRLEWRTDPARREGRLPKGVRTGAAAPETEKAGTFYSGQELLRFEHVEKAFPEFTPLTDLNLSVSRGEVISIIGPSGTGKSTLLRLANGLIPPTGGKVFAFGKDIAAKNTDSIEIREKLGMVFQNFCLFPHLTVIENVMLAPVLVQQKSRQEAYARGMELLRSMGIAEKALTMPGNLSGGQQQRVAIARALAVNPEMLLLDEPTSALDPTMVGEVLSVIRQLARDGMTMMIVTHELSFAKRVATRVLYLDQGGIYEDGTPEQIFNAPARSRTAAFINRLSTCELTITSPDFDFAAMTGALREYAAKKRLPVCQEENLVECFRVLCGTALIPREGEPRLHVFAQYDNRKAMLSLILNRRGDRINPMEDEAIAACITPLVQNWSYSYGDGRNRLTLDGIREA